MSHPSIEEQECREDTARRLNALLTMLEERITVLLEGNDPASMKASEREQAVSRHLTALLHVLQLRQQFAQPGTSPGEQALLDALFRSVDE